MSNTAKGKPQVIKIDPLPVYPDIIIGQTYVGGTADDHKKPPQLHWLLFVQSPESEQGERCMPLLNADGSWAYVRKGNTMIYSASIVVATIIGKLKTHSLTDLDTLLRAIPMPDIPVVDVGREPKFTCRVWIREAVRRMDKASYIQCTDVDALEKELIEYGRQGVKEVEDDTFKAAVLHRAKSSA